MIIFQIIFFYIYTMIIQHSLLLNRLSLIVLWFFVALLYSPIQSQDLEPRLLSAMPTNGNILVASYIHSGGNILIDPSLPVEDLEANLNNIAIAYVRSFKLFNKLTKIDAVIPYSFGKYDAIINDDEIQVNRNGFADVQLRISMILLGVKPLEPKDYFKHAQKKFRLGVNFRVKVPVELMIQVMP